MSFYDHGILVDKELLAKYEENYKHQTSFQKVKGITLKTSCSILENSLYWLTSGIWILKPSRTILGKKLQKIKLSEPRLLSTGKCNACITS